MKRTWLCLSPAAVIAGMLLVHCSSSTTTSTSSSSEANSSTTTSTQGSSATSSTAIATTTAETSGTVASSTKATTSESSTTSAASTSTGPLSDTHDAGPCVGPSGGAECDPGNVECNNVQCAVPDHECCNGSNNSQTCLGVATACSGSKQACDEKSDCPDGQICCLTVTDTAGDFSISCQTGPSCPTGGLATAQICKTNAECPGNVCSVYDCQGNTTEACTAPNFICTMK